jgi:hypothetical protein
VWAFGITDDGFKVPLGFEEDHVDGNSTTESTELVTRLLDNLRRRHLDWRDALWVIDGAKGPHAAIVDATNGEAAIQRCLVHKIRNVIKELPPNDRKEIGSSVRGKLWRAFDQPELADAAAGLLEVASELLQRAASAEGQRQQRLLNAAQMVISNADETLKQQTLGVVTPGRNLVRYAASKKRTKSKRAAGVRRSLDALLATTNIIESVHDRVAEWTKARVSYWQGERMRSRWFVFGLASAEPGWKRLKVNRREAARLQLAILEDRNRAAGVQLQTRWSDGGLTLVGIHVAEGAEQNVMTALSDLARWADRNGRAIDISVEAFELSENIELGEIRRFAERVGFAFEDRGRRALVRSPRLHADAARVPLGSVVDQLSGAVEARSSASGAQLLIAISATAVELAVPMIDASQDQDDLDAELAQLETVVGQLRGIDGEISAWMRKHWDNAAVWLANERAVGQPDRPWRSVLGVSRWRVLGDARAEWLCGQAARAEGRMAGGGALPIVRQPLANLDDFAVRIEQAAAVLAAAHETERRRILGLTGRGAGKSAGAEDASWQTRPMERYSRALGRAAAPVAAYGAAVRPKLEGIDQESLERLRSELATFLAGRLDTASGMETVRYEARQASILDRYTVSCEQEGRYGAVAADTTTPKADRRQVADRAATSGADAAQAWAELVNVRAELARERKNARGRDAFVLRHAGIAALDEGIWLELKRRERELATADQSRSGPAEGNDLPAPDAVVVLDVG